MGENALQSFYSYEAEYVTAYCFFSLSFCVFSVAGCLILWLRIHASPQNAPRNCIQPDYICRQVRLSGCRRKVLYGSDHEAFSHIVFILILTAYFNCCHACGSWHQNNSGGTSVCAFHPDVTLLSFNCMQNLWTPFVLKWWFVRQNNCEERTAEIHLFVRLIDQSLHVCFRRNWGFKKLTCHFAKGSWGRTLFSFSKSWGDKSLVLNS